MRFYLVRHGQSEANVLNLIAGHSNHPLTDSGKQQAKTLGKELLEKEIKFDRVYSSDIRRAAETARIICDEIVIEDIVYDKRLREGDAGLFTGRPRASLTKEEEEFLDSTMRVHMDIKVPDGESNRDMTLRIKEAFFEIVAAHPENSTILLVGHGGTLYHILVKILELLPPELDEWFGSCKLNVLERSSENDAWKVTMFNNRKLES